MSLQRDRLVWISWTRLLKNCHDALGKYRYTD